MTKKIRRLSICGYASRMIRMIQSKSAGQAKAYFREALTQSDYYLSEEELPGSFQGRVSDRMGIKGPASKEVFYALCENIHPITKKPLTPRKVKNRTTGYDINFHVPKSVSVVHILSKDEHILNAFKDSVRETMTAIEKDAQARVRKSGQNHDRQTGEMLWAEFIHQTARAVKNNVSDPHLHCHCYTFNVTWDKSEKKFKAGMFRDINRFMPYYQSLFHKKLSDKLIHLGYGIRQTDTSFEIENVPQNVIDLFSKRTNEIGQIAKEEGITNAKERDKLGARTRIKKKKGQSFSVLKQNWRQQIHDLGLTEQGDGKTTIRQPGKTLIPESTAQSSIAYALNHRFERVSVIHERRIFETAYRFSLGDALVSTAAIDKAFRQDKRIIRVREGTQTLCTTKEVLAEEQRMVAMAQSGMGKLVPLYLKAPSIALTGDQGEAIQHILTATDRVSIVRGGAGTGKTTLMQEAATWIAKTGTPLTVVAPTAQAKGVLKEEGFADAETVAKLLTDTEIQGCLYNGVLWVDEAGLLGTKDMSALLDLAIRYNARLVLSGDTRQHASVIRGDALRILNKVAGIPFASVNKIYRQKNDTYREAVQALADGDIQTAFDRLEEMDAIKTIEPSKIASILAQDYLKTIEKNKTALVISPTHKHADLVTAEIRKGLQDAGYIGQEEVNVTKLINLNKTEAEKSDPRHYKPGYKVQFNQNLPGIIRGSLWTVERVTKHTVEIVNQNGEILALPNRPKEFDVFKAIEMPLSKGDMIRVTRNAYDKNNSRMFNGQLLEVTGVDKAGHIKARQTISRINYTLDSNFGHIDHAYCLTSYASQGKTVNAVFIAQPAASFPATDMKQFYVSVSRARENVVIYTDDKKGLLDHVSETGERQSSMELTAPKNSARTRKHSSAASEQHAEPPTSQKKTAADKKRKTTNVPTPGL